VNRTSVPAAERFVSTHGIDGLRATLEALLDEFRFETAETVAQEYAGTEPHDGPTRPRVGGKR
jgi:hypothetical protein